MAHSIEDRICETSSSTGTGPMTLTSSIIAHKRFSDRLAIGNTFYGGIAAVDVNNVETGQWETGLYTYSALNTITRTTVYASSNADNSRVDFPAGLKRVYLSLTAYQLSQLVVQSQPPTDPPAPPPPSTIKPVPTGIVSGTAANPTIVTLDAGTIYLGTIDISGLSNVTIKSSSPTVKAMIRNGQAVSGWSLLAGSTTIYKAALPFQPDNVAVNKAPAHLAHFPTRAERFKLSTGRTDTSLTYPWPNTDIVGCNLMIRPHSSRIQERVISSMAGNTASHTGGIDAFATDNKEFWIEGHKLHLLTENNSWAYVNGELYLWTADGTDPTSKEVWASRGAGVENPDDPNVGNITRVNGINAANSIDCVIDGVEIMGASRGVDGTAAQGLDVLNSAILNSKDVGIFGGNAGGAVRATRLIVDNCDITNSFHTAIDTFFGGDTSTTRNSRINNAGLVGNPRTARAVFHGTVSTGNVIDNNTISNISYNGIDVNRNYNTTISYNTVDNACAALTDGGGIYTQSVDGTTPVNDPQNLIIEHNTVQNCRPEGVHGIYLDDNAHNVTIRFNTVKNCGGSDGGSNIFLHAAVGTNVHDNTLVADSNATVTQILIASGTTGSPSGNTIHHNTVTTRGDATQVYNLQSTAPLTSYASYSNNTYYHANATLFARTWDGGPSGVNRPFSIGPDNWLAFSGETAATYNPL